MFDKGRYPINNLIKKCENDNNPVLKAFTKQLDQNVHSEDEVNIEDGENLPSCSSRIPPPGLSSAVSSCSSSHNIKNNSSRDLHFVQNQPSMSGLILDSKNFILQNLKQILVITSSS